MKTYTTDNGSRCSGYGVYPGGKKCKGCSDCEGKFLKRNITNAEIHKQFNKTHTLIKITNLNGINMITQKNYFAKAEEIGIENLPDTFKKSHDLVTKVTQSGSNWNTYNSNETIKRMIDLYFDKLSQYKKPSVQAAKAASPISKKAEQKIFVVKPKPVEKQSIEKAKSPEKEVVKHAPKTTKPKRESKKSNSAFQVERLDDEITLIKRYINFHDKQKTRDQLYSLLKSIQKAILERRVNKNSVYGKEVMQIQDSLLGALKHDVKIFDIKIEKLQLERYTNIATGVVPMSSIQLLKRYVGLQNKTGILDKATRLRDLLQKWYDDNVWKNDKYFKYTAVASNNLNDYIQQVHVLKNKNATLKNFTDTELNGLQGLGLDISPSNKFHKLVVEAMASEEYKEAIKNVTERMNKYGEIEDFSGKKIYDMKEAIERSTIGFLRNKFPHNFKVNIAGLGFIPALFAAAAGGAIQAITSHHLSKKKDNLSGAEPKVMSVADAKNETFKEIGLTGDYLRLIGKACAPTSFFLYGKGGSGKSGLALKLADMLYKLKHSVLYVAGEQYGTPSFTELLKKTNISGGENFKIVKSLDILPIKDFDVIVIDSKERANLHKSSDFKQLCDSYPDKIWILTSQATKSGDFKGDGQWGNEVETFIYCENGKATTIDEKNRWGASAEINLF